MEPNTKKRKLAPKVTPSPPESKPPPAHHVEPHYPVQEPPYTYQHEFESFARHLHDAAMFIQRQTESPGYADATVLMLRWEEDDSQDKEIAELEKVFQTNYHYRTQRWLIPTTPNPTAKVVTQVAQFLDNARPNNLLIIYYAGHGFVGPDGQLYWASNTKEDAAKLKWSGISCLLENAQSDILLLLDTCAVADPAVSGSHGVKQTIAARSPDQDTHAGGRSFTESLTDALQKFAPGRAFSAQRLHEDILSQQQRHHPSSPTTNGVSAHSLKPPRPIFFTVTPGKGQSLTISRLPGRVTNGTDSAVAGQEVVITREEAASVQLYEERVLVCTTFIGEASPDMSFFHQWLQNSPALGGKIAIEGIFLGPPTMLLISMPLDIWKVVQHDQVCCYLGKITSHNMLHLYEKLVGPSAVRPSAREADDGRILLEPRDVVASTPVRPHDHRTPLASAAGPGPGPSPGHPAAHVPPHGPTNGAGPMPIPREPERIKFTAHNKRPFPPISPNGANVKGKEEGEGPEGTEEMREAAEQLKALSHVRHRSDEAVRARDPRDRPRTSLPNGLPNGLSERRTELPSLDHDASDMDKNRMKVPRRALPKHETRCSHCSHAPFRDSSSLRKHIAAAHTRPFPCAFNFAGCNSTFGSKNEWKRHITSQHLCLQYYRCSSCPRSAIEGKGNEFNRKDLFTQHLRRMHAPFQIKRPASKGDAKIQAEWELHVRSMQQSCLISRRYPPQKSACPNPDCRSVFEGTGSWDEWTEHVGRHMEKGEASNMGVDHHLIEWALDEGIIEARPGGTYRLTSTTHGNSHNHSISGGSGSGRESGRENGSGPNSLAGSGHENSAAELFDDSTIVVSKPSGPSEPSQAPSETASTKEADSVSTKEGDSICTREAEPLSPKEIDAVSVKEGDTITAKEPDSISAGDAMEVDS